MPEGSVELEQHVAKGVSPALAHVLGWVVIGVEASVLLSMRSDARIGTRLLAAVWNLGQATALGVLTAIAIVTYLRFGSRRTVVRAADAFGVALGVGMMILPDDLGGLAGRLGERWVSIALYGAVVLVAAAVPLAWLVGRMLVRYRQRSIGMGIAVFIGAAHASILAGLYPGMHAFAAWAGAVLFGASLQGAADPVRPRVPLRWQAAGYTLIAELAVFCMALPPPARALVQLVRAPGAVAATYVTQLYPKPRMRRSASVDSEWFRPRGHLPPVPPTGAHLLPKNGIVIFFTGECLRADLLEREADKLPNLNRLAREGVHFTNAHSTSPSTGPTIATLFSGRYYSQLYWTPAGSGDRVTVFANEDKTPRFPAHLTEAGVHTLNLVGQRTMRNQFGHVGGFAEEQAVKGRGWAQPLVDTVIGRIVRHPPDKPLFVYGHFKEGHYPYRGRGTTDWERYIAHLGRVDQQIGRLLDVISKPDLSQRTALILTADHGEAFGEHGLRFHGTSVYEELLHVTFLARVPGVAPRREDRLVSTIDLGPTILDLFGVPTPSHHMGQSLVPYLLGRPEKLTRPIVADSGRLLQAMVFEDGIKIIYDKRLGTSELYDLTRDPGELETLTDQRPELHEERLDILHAFFEAHQLRRKGYEIPFRP